MRATQILQTAVRLIYPPTCLACDALVETAQGLCGPCWRDTPFVAAPVCEACGTPLLIDHAERGELCDDCLYTKRPWIAGRTALIYRGTARRLVLGLKHGDRLDLADPAADWMAAAARDLIRPDLLPDLLVVPIPLHWRRRIKRRYNQSVVLGRGVAHRLSLGFCPDALLRRVQTPMLDGMSADARFAAMAAVITPNPRRIPLLRDRPILLVDDVMTSGATLSAAAGALMQAGAGQVSVLTLARAVKET